MSPENGSVGVVVDGLSSMYEVKEYDAEFRAIEDDAWYNVRVLLEGEVLRIKLVGLGDAYDKLFGAKDFKTVKQVEDFARRFRPLCVQLQDYECSKVVEGMRVCASHWFSPDDMRFYDARVDVIERCPHSKGEDECSCTFFLFWKHGPSAGKLTATNIESICAIKPKKETNPALSSFLKHLKSKISCNPRPKSISKLSFFQRLQQGKRCAKRSVCQVQPFEGAMSRSTASQNKKVNQDVNIGKVPTQYVILVGNIDKGLSPSTIAEFLHKQTSVLPGVYMSPSLSSEGFTRAAIILDCENKLQKLYDFLENPNHMIISSAGRPWMTLEKLTGSYTTKESSIPLLPDVSEKTCTGPNTYLEVVSAGSAEYMKAKRLKDLFSEFLNHQKQLHGSLAVEEGRIFCD